MLLLEHQYDLRQFAFANGRELAFDFMMIGNRLHLVNPAVGGIQVADEQRLFGIPMANESLIRPLARRDDNICPIADRSAVSSLKSCR